MTHAGQIDFAVSPLTAAANSTLDMPGLFASKRNPSIPDVPTVAEQGFDIAPLSIGGLFVLNHLLRLVMQKKSFEDPSVNEYGDDETAEWFRVDPPGQNQA